MKEIKDAFQVASDTSLKTEETSCTNKSVETKPEAAETQVGEAAVIDVKARAEELKSAVAVLEVTEPVTDQPESVEAEFDEGVDAVQDAKDERVEAKSAETKSIEVEDAIGPHAEVVESAGKDATHPESNEEEAVAAGVETEATDEEATLSDDANDDLFAIAAAKLESTEIKVVVAEVNGGVKAAINSSDEKVCADKEGASNDEVAALVINQDSADERIPVDTSEGVATVVKASATKIFAEEEGTETMTSEAVEYKSRDEAESVAQYMDLSTEPTVDDVVAEAVANSETDDEAFPTELKVIPEGDIEKKVAEVINSEAVPIDDEVKEVNAVQEQEIAHKETEASDFEVDTAAESGETTSDTPAHRNTKTIMEEVKAEEVSVVEIDEAAIKETETEATFIDKNAKVVEEEAETETASNTEIAEVAVEKAKTGFTETKEVQLEKSKNAEAEAVKNDFATEKVEDAEQFVDKMPKEAPAVAAVETTPAIVEVSDDEPIPIKQTPALEVASADDKTVEVNLTASAVSEYEEKESLRFSDKFEVDTKPISAVSTLIGRFEHIAKRNATEAASSRTSSRTSSRVSSPLSSPHSSWSHENVFKAVVRSDKVIENSEGPVHVESSNEDVLPEAKADQQAAEAEKIAEVTESVCESSAFEETPAENNVEETATTLNETKTVDHERTSAATDVDGGAKERLVEEYAVEADAEESALEAEDSNEKSDAIEEASVEVVEPKSIDESTETEVKVEKTLAVELRMAESTAEPEDVDPETSTEEESPRTGKGADAPASEAAEAYRAVEEVPVADMADPEAIETQTVLTVYKPTEASILSVCGLEVDAVWNANVQKAAEDATPSATLLVDMEKAVATADFTTDESIESSVPVISPIEEDSSDFASAMKEAHAIYKETKESQVEGGKQKELSQPMERKMSLITSVQTDDGVLANEATKAIVEMAPTPQAMKAANNDAAVAERRPEQLTYEILGVTRANNVIMYHIYMIDHATGEQAMSIPKRYSEFKLLDKQLRALDVPSARGLPVLPKPSVGSFLRGRRSQKTIEMREKAFGNFLHYVRDHEDLHKSVVFQQFIN